jgi:GNAT superfamily N-acetyltransferase
MYITFRIAIFPPFLELYVSTKRWYPPTSPQVVKAQKANVEIFIDVRPQISNINVSLQQMEGDYDIIIATEEYEDSIVEFLRQHFYRHEPLNKCIGAPPDRPPNEIHSLHKLSEGKSLLAVSRNGQRILGVCLNEEVKPNTDQDMAFTHPAYIKIGNLVQKVTESVDIWKNTGADSAVFIRVLGVDQAARGRGIGRALMETTRENARSAGYRLIGIICTSYFSARIAQDIGMESVYSLPYSEYKDDDGHPVFTPPLPHTEINVLLQTLSSETK